MAPGAYDVVFRDVRTRTAPAGLPALSSGLSLPLQLLLQTDRGPRSAGTPATCSARQFVASIAGRDPGVPPACRRTDFAAARAGPFDGSFGAGGTRYPSRAATPGTYPHRHQARVLGASAAPGVPNR